jgi:hypothetical protein
VGFDVVGEVGGRWYEVGAFGECIEHHLLNGVQWFGAHDDKLTTDV